MAGGATGATNFDCHSQFEKLDKDDFLQSTDS